MAIGLDDEFGYLDEGDETEEEIVGAPKIKGAKKESVLPEEDADTEPAAELAEEEKEIEDKAKIEKKPSKTYDSVIHIVKVTTNKEDKALEMISDKVKKKKIGIYSLARPHGLRGYIFLEAPDREHAEEAVYNLPYVKGIIPKLVAYEEIKQMLEPVASEINIEKNDIVEIISEPFKKEKAKVVRVDKAKGECVVSLLGAAVPIPVTVKLDNIRVIRREELEEEQ
jgi:transcription termination/antitermination protein NusG